MSGFENLPRQMERTRRKGIRPLGFSYCYTKDCRPDRHHRNDKFVFGH